jgi:hypothetical protein
MCPALVEGWIHIGKIGLLHADCFDDGERTGDFSYVWEFFSMHVFNLFFAIFSMFRIYTTSIYTPTTSLHETSKIIAQHNESM